MLASWFERQWLRFTAWQILLQPLALVFAVLSAARRLLYRRGVLSAQRLPVPVVVVGNISVGGTGKTPLTLWLAQQLRVRGLHPGIVSRGYGAASREPTCVKANSEPHSVGDEAMLLAEKSACPVWVGADRVATARALLAAQPQCDFILADDGLQHYKLARDFEIAVVDAARGFGNGYLLPAGPLREPVRRLREVQAVVVNGEAMAVDTSAPIFRMRLAGDVVAALRGARVEPLSAWRGRRVHAVAGIGNPARFFDDLRAFGLEVVEHAFADHQAFTPGQLEFGDDLPVLMTEKDAVKCRRFAKPNWFVRPVQAQVDAALVDLILKRTRGGYGSEIA
jgi:tetraacyldisaccharide 4'-kinase